MSAHRGGALAALVLAALLASTPLAAAQTAPVDGLIEGRVLVVSEGAPSPDAVDVELIALDAAGGLSSQTAVTDGTEFRFEVAADPTVSYVLRIVYGGVPYLSDAIVLQPQLPEAVVEISVFATTAEAPALEIVSSVVTVLALDRESSQLTLVREDLVQNPGDRVYVGGTDGVTLRLPLPDGTIDAGAVSDEGAFVVDGGVLTSSAPLRPGATLVVTRYVVGYDRAADAYDLRLTTPLPAQRLEIHVPERFVDDLRALDQAERAPNTTFEGEALLVAALEGPARPGGSLRARLDGLSGRNDANPLTERGGATIAALLAVGLLTAATLVIARSRSGDPGQPGGNGAPDEAGVV